MPRRTVQNVLYPDHWLHQTPLEARLIEPDRACLDAPLPDDDGLDIPTFNFHPVSRGGAAPLASARDAAPASVSPLPALGPHPIRSAVALAFEFALVSLALLLAARVIGGFSMWGAP